MSFATEITKSTAKHRVLVEIDFGQLNTQWVNIGAGIWVVSATNAYAWVDASLLDGFTAQDFDIIGSVKASGVNLDYRPSLETIEEGTYYYNPITRALYVCLFAYDEPFIHIMTIGILTGYSISGFVPVNGPAYFEGRLAKIPSISKQRDPLFFGRIAFGGSTIDLLNGDGALDAWGYSTDIYGQDVRILFGFDTLDYADYAKIFSGYVQTVEVGEDRVSLRIDDKRKQLTKPITYTCTAVNALEAIEGVLHEAYGYNYNQYAYDTTAWEIARAEVEDVTINMQEPKPVIEVIEDIAASVFGLFTVTTNGKFSFRIVDTEDTIDRIIDYYDIANQHAITYDPTEVVSSVRVGYARDWTTTGTQYTYLSDTSEQATVFALYKTYNERKFDTLLPDLTAAQSFATRVLNYASRIHGSETVMIPIENYDLVLGQQIGVVVQRGAQSMIGELKAEVTGVNYDLERAAINATIRHGGALEAFLKLEDDAILISEADALMMED